MSGTPPGWYPDVEGVQRWFDGTSWTEHTQQAAPPVPSTPGAPQWTPLTPAPGGSGPSGFAAPGPAGAVPPPGPPTGPPLGQGSPRKDTGLLVGLGVVGAVLLVAIVVVAVLLVNKGGDSDDSGAAVDPPVPSGTSSSRVPAGPSSGPSSGATAPDPTGSGSSSAGPTSGDSPQAVTQKFFHAIFAGDCAKAEGYVAGAALGGAGGCDSAMFPSSLGGSVKLKVGSAEVTGSTATVAVRLVPDVDGLDGSQYATTLTAELQVQDGAWKITAVS